MMISFCKVHKTLALVCEDVEEVSKFSSLLTMAAEGSRSKEFPNGHPLATEIRDGVWDALELPASARKTMVGIASGEVTDLAGALKASVAEAKAKFTGKAPQQTV